MALTQHLGNYSLIDTVRKEIHCKCGYVGPYKKSSMRSWDMPACPSCKEDVDYSEQVLVLKGELTPKLVRCDVFDDSETSGKIALTLCYVNYLQGKEGIASFNRIIKFSHNIRTGITYFLHGKQIVNATYGGIPPKIRKGLVMPLFVDMINDKKAFETFLRFLTLCMEKRGVTQYRKLVDEEQMAMYVSGRFVEVTTLLQFPALQHFDVYQWGRIPKKLRKPLKQAENSSTKATAVLTGGCKGKEIRELIAKDGCVVNRAALWGEVVKDRNYLCKILKTYDAVGSRHLSIFPYEGPEIHMEKDWKVLRFFRKQFKTETAFVNEVMRCAPKLAIEWMKDALKMLTRIQNNKPGYQLPFRGDIKRYHDILTKEYGRYCSKELVIPYTTEEKKYEMEFKDFLFTLPPTTKTLAEIGTELSHCVGSYANEAVDKRCTIVAVKTGSLNRLCIELVKKRIVQVKGRDNRYPTLFEKQMVEAWAKACGLEYVICDDLRQAS